VKRERPKHWGLRALGFLGIALVCILTSNDGYSLLTATGLLVGLVGAGYCSYRGLKTVTWLPR